MASQDPAAGIAFEKGKTSEGSPTQGSVPALELRCVSASYSASRRIAAKSRVSEPKPLVDVSFALHPGELVAVLGPNGAGKTTLLRVLSGLLRPTQGEVTIFGRPIAALDRRTLARDVAVVAQNEEVPAGFSVRDIVMMGRAPHQGTWLLPTANDAAIVDDAIARCDLGPLRARPVHELSGGERKRVAIARALAQRTRVLLLDEPAAFLDVRHAIALYDRLAEEVARSALSCLVVMHDLNVAAQYAQRIVLLRDGRVIAQGAVEDVMTYRKLFDTFDADLYVGVNELTGARFFLPMRGRASAGS